MPSFANTDCGVDVEVVVTEVKAAIPVAAGRKSLMFLETAAALVTWMCIGNSEATAMEGGTWVWTMRSPEAGVLQGIR